MRPSLRSEYGGERGGGHRLSATKGHANGVGRLIDGVGVDGEVGAFKLDISVKSDASIAEGEVSAGDVALAKRNEGGFERFGFGEFDAIDDGYAAVAAAVVDEFSFQYPKCGHIVGAA